SRIPPRRPPPPPRRPPPLPPSTARRPTPPAGPCVGLRRRPEKATEGLLLDRLQHESLEIGVANDAVIPGCFETHDLPGAVEIDGNDAALCRASVIRPLEAAALITTDNVHEL